MSRQALSGIRVVDLTQVMAGPYCTMLLADLGADVIKIERPAAGDHTRTSWGRPEPDADSAAFHALNRNKRSVCLDLTNMDDHCWFERLVRTADVLVENFRPGVAQRLGADYDTVTALNPRVVYASISGFGHTGPYADRPGYDLIAQAMAGAISVTGTPEATPVKCGLPIGDLGAGLFSAVSILAACLQRQHTGKGQPVETSLYEAILAMSVWESTEYFSTGHTPRPLGTANRMSAPYEAYRTRDGHITIGANNDRLWRRLCACLGRDDLPSDDRFVDNPARLRHRLELADELERALAGRETSEWVDLLLAAGVPCGPVLDYQQILDHDPHAAARGMVQRVEHSTVGSLRLLGSPMKLGASSTAARTPPPLLGEHTAEILAELGKSTDADVE